MDPTQLQFMPNTEDSVRGLPIAIIGPVIRGISGAIMAAKTNFVIRVNRVPKERIFPRDYSSWIP